MGKGEIERPSSVNAAAILFYIFGAWGIISAGLFGFILSAGSTWLIALGSFGIATSIMCIIAGMGLRRMEGWGAVLGLISSTLVIILNIGSNILLSARGVNLGMPPTITTNIPENILYITLAGIVPLLAIITNWSKFSEHYY